ncbi:CBS domain-containing protein [Halocatena pleomorpha]|uniref:CBS domain-containing protein n=1 Tax=Halocatena pleomorpha TaxID=1785090 RepID=A0A3P3RK28_9EURY|nr:CBS domain-containing protein [Halocatena pleomorpha]RRJ33772.1 CBS domain-containing protein [Halocatena pleomorpha]
MDISEAVMTEHASFDPETRVSKLRGAFDREVLTNAILVEGEEVEGVIPRKELLGSHHDPGEKLRSIVRSPPRVSRTEDVRETARLMVESELKLLPVYEGTQFYGVITDHAILDLVLEHLDALSVEDVFTRDLISVKPDDTLGRVINVLRENDISRVPVIEETEAIGLISVFDLVEFIVRKMDRNRSGAPDGFDGHGGAGSSPGFRSNRSFGERVGESARMLDLPARDVMSTPVRTVAPETPLDEAVAEILGTEYSSLVAINSNGTPIGIMTTTDVLRALTVDEESHMDIQVFGVEHLEGNLTRTDIASRIERIDQKYQDMDILEANVVFHEHQERQRGTPLLLVTVRLFTDQGRFVGSAEEYGARPAFKEAAAVAEGNALEDKSRKHPGERRNRSSSQAKKLLSWWRTAE